ncbi:MAG: right-handed parallel beta-helix repeat-containing protein [Proteobacteria bacterium]|nr:right-handed parallel beta-helix repeat-containing protein [Pseudomonadota bacterium]
MFDGAIVVSRKFAIQLAAWLIGFFGVCHVALACDMVVGVGTAYPNLSTVPWPAAGTVCINSGSYDRMLVVAGVRRSAAAPLVIRGREPSDPPRLLQGAVVRNSSYVMLEHLNVANAAGYAAVLLDQGSHHVTVDKVWAHDAPFGIALGSAVQPDGLGGPAGTGNVVQNSGAGTNVRYSGIAIQANSGEASPGDPDYPYATTVRNNNVSGNGGHGISVENARFVKIVGNRVSVNGFNGGGYSGIHLYGSEDNGKCGNNLIRYNYVSQTWLLPNDITASDGNGILMDHYCDSNDVSYNVVWGNHGAGISIFTSADNRVYRNTVFGNTQQPGRTTLFPPPWSSLAEIMGATCAEVNVVTGKSDCGGTTVYPERARGNQVFDNVIQSTVYGVPALYAAPAVTVAALGNRIGPNLYWVGKDAADKPNANWPPMTYGNPTTEISAAYIDRVTGTSGNAVEQPEYDRDRSAAAPQADGLRLAKRPVAVGQALADMPADIAGRAPAGVTSYLGAYHCQAAAAGQPCAP